MPHTALASPHDVEASPMMPPQWTIGAEGDPQHTVLVLVGGDHHKHDPGRRSLHDAFRAIASDLNQATAGMEAAASAEIIDIMVSAMASSFGLERVAATPLPPSSGQNVIALRAVVAPR